MLATLSTCRRRLFALLLLSALLHVGCSASPSPTPSPSQSRDLYCALCEAVVDEMESAIGRVEQSHAHTVQTAWRIDQKRRIPYARTESVLLGLLEDDLPPLIKLYGVTNHTGRQRLLRRHDAPQLDKAPLIPEQDSDSANTTEDSSSSSQSPYSSSEFSSSSTLTSTLSALYDRMLDSYLEDFILAFHKQVSDVKQQLCVSSVRACKKGTSFEPFRRPRRQGQEQDSSQSSGEQVNHVDL